MFCQHNKEKSCCFPSWLVGITSVSKHMISYIISHFFVHQLWRYSVPARAKKTKFFQGDTAQQLWQNWSFEFWHLSWRPLSSVEIREEPSLSLLFQACELLDSSLKCVAQHKLSINVSTSNFKPSTFWPISGGFCQAALAGTLGHLLDMLGGLARGTTVRRTFDTLQDPSDLKKYHE